MPRTTPFKSTWRHVAEAARDAGDMAQFALDLRTRMMVGRAMEEGRIRLAYQPVVRSGATTQIAFWEALVRIRDRDGSLIAPGRFLPAIRGTSLGTSLDCEVLGMVLDQLAERPDLRISVNVGPDSFGRGEWIDVLDEALARNPDLGLRLIVEVTEDVATAATPQGEAFLAALRDAGVSLALDDFGGGVTSIRQFRDTRFDILKLDASLCADLAADRDNQVLVGAMIGIARHYEMMTVAEHIDNPEDAAAAARAGVDTFQGYRYGKPAADIPFRPALPERRSAV